MRGRLILMAFIMAALLGGAAGAHAQAQEPDAAPPVPTQEVLQLRADIERLTLLVEHLSRELAKAQGLIDALLRPTTERLQREHEQLEADIQRAGFVRDAQGRVVRPPQTEAQQASETPGAKHDLKSDESGVIRLVPKDQPPD